MDCQNQSYEMNKEHYDQMEISTNPYYGSGKQQTKPPSTVTNTEPKKMKTKSISHIMITAAVLISLLALSLVAMVAYSPLADYLNAPCTVHLHGNCTEETRSCTMFQSSTTNSSRYCATSQLTIDHLGYYTTGMRCVYETRSHDYLDSTVLRTYGSSVQCHCDSMTRHSSSSRTNSPSTSFTATCTLIVTRCPLN